jgi:hypothetical protein
MAHRLLIAGGILAATGLFLWWALPIQEPFPPFLLTALLTLMYGATCFWMDRRAAGGKKS